MGEKMEASGTTRISGDATAVSTVRDLIRLTLHNNNYNRGEGTELMFGVKDIVKAVYAAYRQYLPDSLETYNARQKKNRHKQYKSYVDVVSKHQSKQVAVEVLLQIGNKDVWDYQRSLPDDDPDKISPDQYRSAIMGMKDIFCKFFPDFKPVSGTMHWDEASPHMHMVGIPVIEVAKAKGQEDYELIPGLLDRKGKPIPAPEMIEDKKTGKMVVSMTQGGNPQWKQKTDPKTGEKIYKKRQRNADMTYDIGKTNVFSSESLKAYHVLEREYLDRVLPQWNMTQKPKGLPRDWMTIPEYKAIMDKVKELERQAAELAEKNEAQAADIAAKNAEIQAQRATLQAAMQAVMKAQQNAAEITEKNAELEKSKKKMLDALAAMDRALASKRPEVAELDEMERTKTQVVQGLVADIADRRAQLAGMDDEIAKKQPLVYEVNDLQDQLADAKKNLKDYIYGHSGASNADIYAACKAVADVCISGLDRDTARYCLQTIYAILDRLPDPAPEVDFMSEYMDYLGDPADTRDQDYDYSR